MMETVNYKSCVCINKDEDYFIYFTPSGSCDEIIIYFISTECKGVRKYFSFDLSNAEILTEMKQEICNFKHENGKCIGAILNLFDLNGAKNGYLFRQSMKSLCNDLQIPYQFINASTLILSSILFGSKISVNNNDLVTVVHVTATNIVISDLRQKNNQFLIEEKDFADLNAASEELQKMAMLKNPCKIILSFTDPWKANVQKYRNIFKSDKTMFSYRSYSKYIFESFLAMLNDLRGIEANKFKVSPSFNFGIFVSKQQISEPYFGSFIMECKRKSILPFSQNADISLVKDEKICVYMKNFEEYECLETIELSKFSSPFVCINLSIDTDSFYTLKILPIDCALFLCQSVVDFIFEFSENGISLYVPGYGKIKDENENSCISYFLSFLNEPVKVGESAKADLSSHPTFVVYDLLEILKMVTSRMYQKSEWKFQVKKDTIGFLQIIFDTWRGKRKATPNFLIAIILNHLIKNTVERIGFRPRKFQFSFEDKMRWMRNAVTNCAEILKLE